MTQLGKETIFSHCHTSICDDTENLTRFVWNISTSLFAQNAFTQPAARAGFAAFNTKQVYMHKNKASKCNPAAVGYKYSRTDQ